MSREEFRECPGRGTATGPGTPPLAPPDSALARMLPPEETVLELLAALLLVEPLLLLHALFDGRGSEVDDAGGS